MAKREIKILFNQMTQERLGLILSEQQPEQETSTNKAVSQNNLYDSRSSENISGIDHYDSPSQEHFIKMQKIKESSSSQYSPENEPKKVQPKKEKHLVGTYESDDYDLKIFAKQSKMSKKKTPKEWLEVIKKFSIA